MLPKNSEKSDGTEEQRGRWKYRGESSRVDGDPFENDLMDEDPFEIQTKYFF